MSQKKKDEAHLEERVKGAVYTKNPKIVPYVRRDAGSKQVKRSFGFIPDKKKGKR